MQLGETPRLALDLGEPLSNAGNVNLGGVKGLIGGWSLDRVVCRKHAGDHGEAGVGDARFPSFALEHPTKPVWERDIPTASNIETTSVQ